jgi:cadmium resistance protein CadD (predicted permease)
MIKRLIEKLKTLRLYFVICRFLPYLILILIFLSCLIALNFMMDKNIFGYVGML